ncbi:hypothetical protein IE4872_CH01605 [Rhizobium gallicum]|uniref:Uncharacterized protein n=1 Tax=Rhizobium gallicum TaxID=56730 RepID=A0A1L5NH91_9HYPH|nr:hypothetical protein [Rhizobium gallicum]APO67247.1 hypothetical protein IE4872_CH01605 [Rhizobium gallicum]
MSDDNTDDLFSNSELLAGDGLGPWPIFIKEDEGTNVKNACALVGRDDKTIRKWCKKYGIGSAMPGSPILISIPGLMMVLYGDVAALELLRQGNRSHPRVSRYFDGVGVRE